MSDESKRDILILPFAAVVLLSFIASLVDWILTKDSTGLTFTMPLMVALSGYVLGVQIFRRGSNGGDG